MLTIIQAKTPPAAANEVLTKISATAVASAPEPSASCDPPLKPNQPSHRMNTPNVVIGNEHPGKVLTEPSLPNLPSRAPNINAPANAAQPPTEWTKVEPAKSEKPISLNQPPPHCHEPAIGYINAVRIATNKKKGQILILSAKVPDTIDAVVATNTIWKNQSDAAA